MARKKHKDHWTQILTGPIKMAVGVGIWSVGKLVDRPETETITVVKTTRRVKHEDGSITTTIITRRTKK